MKRRNMEQGLKLQQRMNKQLERMAKEAEEQGNATRAQQLKEASKGHPVII